MTGRHMIQGNVSFLNLDKIAQSGQCFRWLRVGEQDYVIPAFGKVLHIRQPVPGLAEADCTPEDWEGLWKPYLDLNCDYGLYQARVDRQDAYLTAAMTAAHGIRVLHQPLWETIASFIISQNNNIPRIKKSLLALCGGAEKAFAAPEAVAELTPEALSFAGLGYRAPYLKNAALRYIQDGLSDSAAFADYGEAKSYFQSYYGIGPKVADCICLYALGLKDAFPMDTWVKRILSRHYSGAFPFFRYEGFAGVLQQWMFYYERERENGRL